MHLPLLPSPSDGSQPVAVTSLHLNGESFSPGIRPLRCRDVASVTSIRQLCRIRLIASEKGEKTMRRPAHTSEVIRAIGDGRRALNVMFMDDGLIDQHEMHVIRLFRGAQALAIRADWDRKARQSLENEGKVNGQLLRELREIEEEFPLDAA